MAKNLVIVESPAKVKTIKKYLGKNYEVVASKGHVRDLPKSTLGVDVENDFEPKYITIRGKGDTISQLRKRSKEADKVYLATDPDREGEAISWHLMQLLGLDEKKSKRITFNEITKNAVSASLKNSRDIDMNLVDAQQARRVLDRLVGYGISPVLWQKVKRGLSAGRVQSSALRMICDRDREIAEFVPEEYWSLSADIFIEKEKKPVKAKFYGDGNGKIEVKSEADAQAILNAVSQENMRIVSIKNSEKSRNAPFPFVTSTLQQEASKALGFTTQKTMRVAQGLYESGMITYLRTDSVRISDEAVAMAKGYIAEKFGNEYVSFAVPKGKNKTNVQDAHEAIRPTNINTEPESVKEKLDRDSFRLYQLIWKRFTASRMTAAKYAVTSIDFASAGYIFKASASNRVFDGFMKVYTFSDEEKEEKNAVVAKVKPDCVITDVQYDSEQHFTQPPAHFTEASLVKAMEEAGIGRPSTYAPTISTISGRGYIKKEKKSLIATELGTVVNDIMVTAFPQIVDIKFTANVEDQLDEIEDGKVQWKQVIRDFYPGLKKSIDDATVKLEKIKIKDEETDEVCELCGRNMVIKMGRYGKFLACPGFPECRNTRPLVIKSGAECPQCGKDLITRKTKKGKTYYSCSGYPQCTYMSWNKPKTQSSKSRNSVSG